MSDGKDFVAKRDRAVREMFDAPYKALQADKARLEARVAELDEARRAALAVLPRRKSPTSNLQKLVNLAGGLLEDISASPDPVRETATQNTARALIEKLVANPHSSKQAFTAMFGELDRMAAEISELREPVREPDAVKQEREACARLCEQKYKEWCSDPTSNAIQAAPLAKQLANLIRAREGGGENG